MTRREYTVRTVEHAIDARPPWGATFSEISKALRSIETEYRQLHGLTADASIPDDALTMFPGDDELIIRFTIKEAATR
ncbi:hypothetical protein B4N89_27475 [Embleya scabrispora]|uniref:Uncharacterized protein n=1 Tax=Embleya scabrispora TaxID=159449 RepID=A0A1T3P4Z6_9ACTN|nr:hypothetical protein [Embleya scabrispora]OPC84169.1 hypothetical protein B4N89_27475 [Embleya scabrispora]